MTPRLLYTLIYLLIGGPAFRVTMITCGFVTLVYVATIYSLGLGVTGAALADLLAALSLGMVAMSIFSVGLYLLLMHHAAAALGRHPAVALIWPRTSNGLTTIRDCIIHAWRSLIIPPLPCFEVLRLIPACLPGFQAAWKGTPTHLSTSWAASSHPHLA